MKSRYALVFCVAATLGAWACGDRERLLQPMAAGDPAPASASLALSAPSSAATVFVSVVEFAFRPQVAIVGQGGTVQWNFNGEAVHTATDKTGMSLFDSGFKDPGQTYPFTFASAGNYPYHCNIHNFMTGNVKVPIKVAPATGGVTTRFLVTWSAAAATAPYVFDIRIKRPGSTSFVNWKRGRTTRRATFTPDAGPGTYSFQARLRKTSNGAVSLFSPPRSISVS